MPRRPSRLRSEPAHTSSGGGGHGGASARWLVSYADFITLMMVVFMVLYSMAKVDSGKYGKLKASLAQSIGGGAPLPVGGNPANPAPVQPGPDPVSIPGNPAPADPDKAVPAPPVVTPPAPDPEPSAPVRPPADPMQPVLEELRGTSAARAGNLTVTLQDRGVMVTVVTSLLFAEGRAELKPEAAAILDQISTRLKGSADPILVEGSPDAALQNAPWDLSARRASAVVRHLVERQGLSPDRFAVLGYGKSDGVEGIVNVVVLRRK